MSNAKYLSGNHTKEKQTGTGGRGWETPTINSTAKLLERGRHCEILTVASVGQAAEVANLCGNFSWDSRKGWEHGGHTLISANHHQRRIQKATCPVEWQVNPSGKPCWRKQRKMLASFAADLWELIFEQTSKGKEMVCFLVASSHAEAGVDRAGT